MKERDLRGTIANDYLTALLRSRRAVDRILDCVADIAERDENCARAIAEHPEAIAALSRSAAPAQWLLEAALGRRANVSAARRPASPYLRGAHRRRRRISGARRRKH